MHTKFNVEGMGCQKCENKIKAAVGAINGVANVAVDLEGKTVTIEHNPDVAALDKTKGAIEELGYEIEG